MDGVWVGDSSFLRADDQIQSDRESPTVFPKGFADDSLPVVSGHGIADPARNGDAHARTVNVISSTVDHENVIGHDVPGAECAIEIALLLDASSFGKAFVLGLGHHTNFDGLIHDLGIGDQLEELRIALETRQLFGQLFHRIDRVH